MQAINQNTTIFFKLQQSLFTPIPIGGIVFFRVIFGLILVWEVCRYYSHGWIEAFYITPNFHFKYYGFSWVRPWPGDGMYYHFAAIGVCAFCFSCGFLYRMSSVFLFFLFTYWFLLDQSVYLNHYYLIALLLFIMIFLPANRAFSIDALLWPKLKERSIHRWTLWLLRFQIGCVYVFGGIAKINPDWLRGEPMRQWLGDMAHYQVVGKVLASEFSVWAISYGGIFFDLGIVWLLLYKRTRALGVLLVCFFHLSNSVMFGLGTFPWMMIFVTPLFMPADWPHRMITRCFNRRLKDVKGKSSIAPISQKYRWQQQCVCWLIIIFVTLQCLIPLRHYFYPGDANWTEEGQRFSWRMMLRAKSATLSFSVKTEQSATNQMAFNDYLSSITGNSLNSDQATEIKIHPDMIIQYAHFIVNRLQEIGHRDIIIHVRSQAKLNDRPLQTFIDPKANLAVLPRDLKHCNWIVPLESRVK